MKITDYAGILYFIGRPVQFHVNFLLTFIAGKDMVTSGLMVTKIEIYIHIYHISLFVGLMPIISPMCDIIKMN